MDQPDRPDMLITSNGMMQEVTTLPDINSLVVPGEHLWLMISGHRITNPEDAFDPSVPKYLDMENLVSLDGPGCYVCEQMWDSEIGAQPCPGEPRG